MRLCGNGSACRSQTVCSPTCAAFLLLQLHAAAKQQQRSGRRVKAEVELADSPNEKRPTPSGDEIFEPQIRRRCSGDEMTDSFALQLQTRRLSMCRAEKNGFRRNTKVSSSPETFYKDGLCVLQFHRFERRRNESEPPLNKDLKL